MTTPGGTPLGTRAGTTLGRGSQPAWGAVGASVEFDSLTGMPSRALTPDLRSDDR